MISDSEVYNSEECVLFGEGNVFQFFFVSKFFIDIEKRPCYGTLKIGGCLG